MQTTLQVEGMSCAHCEAAVKKAVCTLAGVTDVTVDLQAKSVTITHDDRFAIDQAKAAIEEQGYDVV